MKHTDGKVTLIKIEDEDVILETKTKLRFKVPLSFMIGVGDAGYSSKTYREFIVKHLHENNVYMPPDLI